MLVRLVRVSRASWQPVLWYEVPAPGVGTSYPAPGVLPPTPVEGAITTNEDRVQLGRGQLRSPPSSTVSAPVPTTTASTILGGSRPNTQPTGLIPLNPQQHPGRIEYNMTVCNRQSDVPVRFSPILAPKA